MLCTIKRRPDKKIASQEDNLADKQPHNKKIKQEDNFTG